MKFRKVSKPKQEMVRDGNSVVLRFTTGANAGRPVPTRGGKKTEVVCARCTLPSYPGLPPFVKALGFDRKTGEAIEQYVHQRCPGNTDLNHRIINANRIREGKERLERSKLPRGGRTWSVKRLFGK